MKDITGREVKVGDRVAYIRSMGGTKVVLDTGVVSRVTETAISTDERYKNLSCKRRPLILD